MRDQPGGLPRILGSYELVERVGAGGMGVVYRAIDRRTGSTVAVKIIHEHLQDPTFVARFRDEAHFASLLTSPYIVRAIEFGHDQGQYFLVTEYAEGSMLSELIATQKLSTDAALAIGTQVTMALQAAAAHGVVHRDIKPDNIIITKDNSVKLMDFGVARLSYIETRQLFLGTVAYAAPEQFRGQTTIQSDIYSLGVVMFQMLAGEVPFQGDTLSSLIRMHDEVPPPLEKLSSVPAALREVVAKCLEKDPSKRYAGPSELLAALRQVSRSMEKPDDATWIAGAMTQVADAMTVQASASTPPVAVPPPVMQPPVATPTQGWSPPPGAPPYVPPPRPPVEPPRKTARGFAGVPLPILIGGGAVIAALAIGMVALAGGGSDSKDQSVAAETPTAVAEAVAPPAVPAPEPTAVPVPPPVAPAAAPPAAAPPVAVVPAPVVVAPAPVVVAPAPQPQVIVPVPLPPTPTPVPPPPPATAFFSFVGFSDHPGGGNSAPGDVVRPGGSLRACNPASLYAWVDFSGLTPPKQFSGEWTQGGAVINRQSFTQTSSSATTFWQVQNGTPAVFNPGQYRFQLSVDGAVVSQATFTLAC